MGRVPAVPVSEGSSNCFGLTPSLQQAIIWDSDDQVHRRTNVYIQQMDHDDVIKWKHFPRYWPFVRGIHRSPVNSPHKGQWRGALMFSLIFAGINGWAKNREAGDLKRYLAHCDVTVMIATENVAYTAQNTKNTEKPFMFPHSRFWHKYLPWVSPPYKIDFFFTAMKQSERGINPIPPPCTKGAGKKIG